MQPIDSEMAETGGAAGRRTPREPLLSIVFYFIKPAEFLNDAISTVVSQQTEETELIVVAGHSPGEELGIAPAFVSRIDRLIAEPDRGGWDAANKGWRAAQGRWTRVVISDDGLPPGGPRASRTKSTGCVSTPARARPHGMQRCCWPI